MTLPLVALIRLVALLFVIGAAFWIVLTHGVRGVVVLIAIVLAVTVPRTAVWRYCERWLVRLTGSRRRAAVVVLTVIIFAGLAVNFVPLLVR
jgi:hypothetical protein